MMLDDRKKQDNGKKTKETTKPEAGSLAHHL